ncbi:hypothetical protein O6H91_09G002200 [Diphasiastrum complanatum]|uniref:Uncharacterized protein n=1 Tax=Diphasiastrum complanatum TaxID=34168 RepID=A0ACC2CKS9_DIPCM|nr:hypothetical protein O6H91_09G002200 [Diphasiastrum complanatum]
MGFDPECLLSINVVPRELFCPICRQLVYPTESQQTLCGHIYCQPCISYVVNSTRQCPLDGAVLSHSEIKETNPLLHSTLGQVAVRCLYYRSGCSWQGELVNSLAHTVGCSYGSFPVQCNRCGQQILHRQVQDHARTCVGIASQVYAPEQTAGQQHSLPNSSTSQTEQHIPQQVAEVNAAYQGFSGSLTEQQQQQQQQQVLDGRQLQNVIGQEQQQVLAAGQLQGGPQLYPTEWYYQQYYQQQPQQNEQQLPQIVPQQHDSIRAQEQYPVQQAQHDNAKLQQQLLQEQQKPQHLWMQQLQQSGWEQSSGSSGLQQGQIAALEGSIYQQVAAAPQTQQYAVVQQLPLEKYEQQHQQFASQGNGLSAQPLQQLHQHMLQTPSELNRGTYLQQQVQTYPQQDTPGVQPQQQQQYQKFPYQLEHQQPYVNPEQHQFLETHPENLSVQNDLQERQLSRNMYGSHEYPRQLHPNQKISFNQQQGAYEHSVHQQNQAAPFDHYQQHPLLPNQYQQSQHDQKQAMLPMKEIREAGTNGQPIHINGSDPHFYLSPVHPQQFHNSQPFPLPEDPLREGDRKQSNRFSLPQHASPGRSPHDSMESINRQQIAMTNQLYEPKNPREMASDVGVPLATYIQQQQDQLHKQRELPQKGAPFMLEHDNTLQPPFLEQATHKQLNWNRQQRPDMMSPPSQGVSSRPLDTEILTATQQGYDQKMASMNVPGPPEQFYRPHPQMRPSALISSYGKQPDGFRPENLENSSLGFISTPGASWNQGERPLSGYKAKEHLEFAEQPDVSKFSKPFVDGLPEKRYSEQLKHAQNLVARFGADNADKRHPGEDVHLGHDKNTPRGTLPNFSSESLDFASDRILAKPHRNFPKPNEHSLWSNPGLRVQEEPITNSVDPFRRHIGPTRDFSRPISKTGSPPLFENYAGSVHFPSEVRADPLIRSQLMPMQDTRRSKFDFVDPRTEPRFMDLERPMPWTRGSQGLPGLPPQLLGPRNIHTSTLLHRTGDAALLPFGPENIRNPFLDSQLNSSRPSMMNRERPSLPAGRPLFFDAPDSRLGPSSRRFMGLPRHEFANGGPQLEPFNTVTNDEPHDHGRKRKVVDSSVWCRICEVDCFSVQGLEKHSQSAEHQKMAMQLVLSIKEDDAKRTRKEEDAIDEKSSSDGGGSPE